MLTPLMFKKRKGTDGTDVLSVEEKICISDELKAQPIDQIFIDKHINPRMTDDSSLSKVLMNLESSSIVFTDDETLHTIQFDGLKNSLSKYGVTFVLRLIDLQKRIMMLKERFFVLNTIDLMILWLHCIITSLFEDTFSEHIDISIHKFKESDDVYSVIGDHVVASDKLKMELLEKALGFTDPQVVLKQKIYEQKISFNQTYNALMKRINEYEMQCISHIMFELKQNPTDAKIKASLQSMKNSSNTVKGIDTFCVIYRDFIAMRQKQIPNNLIHPNDFLASIVPEIHKFVVAVNCFNLRGEFYDDNDQERYSVRTKHISIHESMTDPVCKDLTRVKQTLIQWINEAKKSSHEIVRILCGVYVLIHKPRSERDIIESVFLTETPSDDLIQIMGLVHESPDIFVDTLDQKTLCADEWMLVDSMLQQISVQKDSRIIDTFLNAQLGMYVNELSNQIHDRYPFIPKNISDRMIRYAMARCSTIHIIAVLNTVSGPLRDLDRIALKCAENFRELADDLPIATELNITYQGIVSSHSWSKDSVSLVTKLTQCVRETIMHDSYLAFQIMLVYDTIQYIVQNLHITSTKHGDVEYHVKGGFCRDIILRVLSEAQTQVQTFGRFDSSRAITKVFTKSLKDIDIAMNIDPELFTFYLCKIAVEKYDYCPIKRWNNAEKTEKGKNISVWSVKLMEEYEPMEFVHFRSDVYDPETSAVVATDIYSSLDDDIRRDVPWPSLRLNDMSLVDYFDIVGMLNRGHYFMRTPPAKEQVYKRITDAKYAPINIDDAKINFQTHIEAAERIIRLFKFISAPFNAVFAYGYDSETNKFTDTCVDGFQIHPDLIAFYQFPSTDQEHEALNDIHHHIKKWLNGGILANVFKSILQIPRKSPDTFFGLLNKFRLMNVIFDNNYQIEKSLRFSQNLSRMIVFSGVEPTLPYMILGLGVKDMDLMCKHMKLLSLSTDTQTMARIVGDSGDLLFSKSIETLEDYQTIRTNPKIQNFVLELLCTSSSSYYFVYCIELIKILGFSLNIIDSKKYTDYVLGKKIRDKLNGCFAQLIGDYVVSLLCPILVSTIDTAQIHTWFIDRVMDSITMMVARIIGTPYSEDQKCYNMLDTLIDASSCSTKIVNAKVFRSLAKLIANTVKDRLAEEQKETIFDTNTLLILNNNINRILQKIFNTNIEISHTQYIKPITMYLQQALDTVVDVMNNENPEIDVEKMKRIISSFGTDGNAGSFKHFTDLFPYNDKSAEYRINLLDNDLEFPDLITFRDAKALEKYLQYLLK